MDYLKAFLIGGCLCLLGQILIDKTKLTPARILVGYVVTGVILGGLNIYDAFAEFAGAGATVPLTGFGHNMAKGVRSAIETDGFIGIFTGDWKKVWQGVKRIFSAVWTGIKSVLSAALNTIKNVTNTVLSW